MAELGIIAPGWQTTMPASQWPIRAASWIDRPASRAAKYAAAKLSPAAVVSTGATGEVLTIESMSAPGCALECLGRSQTPRRRNYRKAIPDLLEMLKECRRIRRRDSRPTSRQIGLANRL